MPNYAVSRCQVRSYEEGVILTVCDAAGKMLGDICCTPKRKVEKLDLIRTMKDLLKSDDTFDILMRRAILQLKPFVETIDIKLVF
jgi:hypothetical protein